VCWQPPVKFANRRCQLAAAIDRPAANKLLTGRCQTPLPITAAIGRRDAYFQHRNTEIVPHSCDKNKI